jgi:hypothetical protein
MRKIANNLSVLSNPYKWLELPLIQIKSNSTNKSSNNTNKNSDNKVAVFCALRHQKLVVRNYGYGVNAVLNGFDNLFSIII